MEWLLWSESRTDSLEVKLVISSVLRYHAGILTEVHTWAICLMYYNLNTDWPQVPVGPLILTMPLSLLTEIYGNFRIPWIPHVGLDEPGALLRAYLLSHLPPPMLHYPPYVILNMPSSWKLSFWRTQSLTGMLREANHYPQFSWISPNLCELYTFNYIPPIIVSTEKGWKVSMVGLITSSVYPCLLSIIPQGYKRGIFLLLKCQELSLCTISSSFLWWYLLCTLSWSHDGWWSAREKLV